MWWKISPVRAVIGLVRHLAAMTSTAYQLESVVDVTSVLGVAVARLAPTTVAVVGTVTTIATLLIVRLMHPSW